jgi:undecaprenyl-diphosphatase
MEEQKNFLILILISVLIFIFSILIGDEKIFLFFNKEIANPILDFIVLKIFTPLFFLLPIIPFLMIFKKERNLGIFSLFSGPFCYLLGNMIKYILRFPRPFNILPARTLGPWHPSPFSFPSTTTMLAFGFAIPIFLKKKKIGIFLLFLAFLVGFSVIYTGYHFLKDVAAGIFFSALIVFFENKIYEKFFL